MLNADLASVRVRARVILPTTALSLGDLARLEHGAVIPLGTAVGTPAELVVNGRPLAEGEIVEANDRRAFELGDAL